MRATSVMLGSVYPGSGALIGGTMVPVTDPEGKSSGSETKQLHSGDIEPCPLTCMIALTLFLESVHSIVSPQP